jgi:hypothetical protein
LISFKHPFSGRQLTIESEVPLFFTTLVGSFDPAKPPAAPVKSRPIPSAE